MSSLAVAGVVSKPMIDAKPVSERSLNVQFERVLNVLASDKQELPADRVADRVSEAVDRALANGSLPA